MQPAAPDERGSAYEDDLIEDMATPTRTPKLAGGPSPPPPQPEWQPLPTGPMQPIEPERRIAPPQPQAPPPVMGPPPSQRHFTPPPSHQSIGPVSAATSSARVRQVAPMDTPPYPSQHGPVGPASQQQITGPQMPIPMTPSTGSFPTAGSQVPLSSRSSTVPEDGVPLGYVVASAFFLAIALVGFGLYLAFEVISL